MYSIISGYTGSCSVYSVLLSSFSSLILPGLLFIGSAKVSSLKVKCDLDDVFKIMNQKLRNGGLLLTTAGKENSTNVMTIGWCLAGVLWGEPICMVAVRPSRHTFKLIEESGEFTVNIPKDGMEEAVAYCGKVSGRDYDKFKESKLATEKGRMVKSPLVTDCVAHLECRVIGKSKVVPDLLTAGVKEKAYPNGDYHTLYYGRLISVLRDK
jgi:flavin reductase (DIM6/NTAB) family NADH-FMN oxidoreductase RutF